MKKIVYTFVLALLPLVCSAYDAQINGICYNLFSDTQIAEVTQGYEPYKGTIHIPATVEYKGVVYNVKLSEKAFGYCRDLTSIVLPEGMKEISNRAFIGCWNLKSVSIPSSMETIGEYAFSGCSSLTAISIPNAVSKMGKGVFNQCENLSSVNIPKNMTSIPDGAFRGCNNMEMLDIPDNIKSIEDNAFCESGLKSIIIPESVTELGKAIFRLCINLRSVQLPNNLMKISDYMFDDCKILTAISIPLGVESIGERAFEGTGITTLNVPSSVTSIGAYAFCYSQLESIVIPEEITTINNYTFDGCFNLKYVTLGSKVDVIGEWAFGECESLTDFYCYTETVPDIANKAVFDHSNIKYATLHVPVSAVESYKATAPWNEFGKIEAIEGINTAYLPFVELGKQWHVVDSPTNPYVPCHLGKYSMSEEVERDGKTYVHAYLRPDDDTGTWQNAGLFREENRRVYKYDETAGREFMLYDFSLKEGDTFIYEPDSYISIKCKVLKQGWLDDGPQIVTSCTPNSDNTWDIQYRPLRTWTIGCDDGKGNYYERITWVECIGTLRNMFFSPFSVGSMTCLAYIERTDHETDYYKNVYLPFSLYQMYGPVYGCDLPTGAKTNEEDNDRRHHLTYELEGNRLHVYGEVYTQCGPNNYAYFYQRSTDDPSVYKMDFVIQEVEPLMDCRALHTTDFYVEGFDPNMSYIIVDNQGEEHPVIKKPADYRPMIEDGKVWQVGAIDTGNPVQWVEYYYFDGETVIDGKTCKQMMWKRYINPDLGVSYSNNSPEYVGAWYEEDKKVYAYDETDKRFKLMYDFSVDDNATLQMDGQTYMIGPRQAGGMNYFKGMWRNVWKYENGETTYQYAPWLEGVGTVYGPPTINLFSVALGDPMWFLMSCTVGDEVIYYDGFSEDGATPGGANAPKRRFDFTHTTKLQPKAPVKRAMSDACINSSEREVAQPKVKVPRRSEEEQSLYGEYNDVQLGINLDPLEEAYVVRITDETGKTVYDKTINAGNIVGLNIDISGYAAGLYTVIVENNNETFTGEFETQTTGIVEVRNKRLETVDNIYNLQGQRLSSLQRGLNIVNGKKVFVK